MASVFSTHSHSRGFGQSNSLPTAGSVGGGMGRRNPRQYQIPARNVPSARLGLLGTSGFVSSAQRNTTTNPTIMKQGRQVSSVPAGRWASPTQEPRGSWSQASEVTPCGSLPPRQALAEHLNLGTLRKKCKTSVHPHFGDAEDPAPLLPYGEQLGFWG